MIWHQAYSQFETPLKVDQDQRYPILNEVEIKDLTSESVYRYGRWFYIGIFLIVYAIGLQVWDVFESISAGDATNQESGPQGEVPCENEAFFLDREGYGRPIYIAGALISLLSVGALSKYERSLRAFAHRRAGIPDNIYRVTGRLSQASYEEIAKAQPTRRVTRFNTKLKELERLKQLGPTGSDKNLIESIRQNLTATDLSGGELLILLASASVAGLARRFSGFGAALIFMPLVSSVISPKTAAPLLLVIDAVAASGLLPDAWRRADRRGVGTMALGALIGIPLGTSLLVLVDALTVRWIITAVVAALLVLLVSGWRYHGQPSNPLTIAVGAVSGLFAGAAQVGGPPVVAYWLGGSIPSPTVRANIVLYFAVSTVLTAVSYFVGDLIKRTVMVLSLMTGPMYGLSLYLGARLFSRAAEATFRRICFGLIAAALVLGLPVLDAFLR